MTKEDFEKIEQLFKQMLEDMLYQEEVLEVSPNLTATFSVEILDKIEDFLGHPIDYMGIS
jgi:hypothetical protein